MSRNPPKKFYHVWSVEYSWKAPFELDVCYEEWYLRKETLAGYWITINDPNSNIQFHSDVKDKWVSKTSIKRYAYPTKKEALISYIKRKEKQIKILERQLSNTKEQHRYAMEVKGRDYG